MQATPSSEADEGETGGKGHLTRLGHGVEAATDGIQQLQFGVAHAHAGEGGRITGIVLGRNREGTVRRPVALVAAIGEIVPFLKIGAEGADAEVGPVEEVIAVVRPEIADAGRRVAEEIRGRDGRRDGAAAVGQAARGAEHLVDLVLDDTRKPAGFVS